MGQYKRAEENDLKATMKPLFPDDVEMICISKDDYDRLYGDLTYENVKLKDRINKAIEYINEMCLCSDGYANYGDDLSPEYIVNILKGDNK